MSVLPRLPHTNEAKLAISLALRGRKHSEVTKAKISAAMIGRRHSEATKAKLRAARARPRQTGQEHAKDRRQATKDAIRAQWRRDQYAAVRLRDLALFRDVKRSNGWRTNRTLFDPTGAVSDGYGPPRPPKHRRLEDIRLERLLRGEG